MNITSGNTITWWYWQNEGAVEYMDLLHMDVDRQEPNIIFSPWCRGSWQHLFWGKSDSGGGRMFPKSQFLFHVPSMAQHLVAGWDRRPSLEGDQHTWCGLCSAWWVLLSHPQCIVPLLYFSITCGVGMWCEWSWREPYHFTWLCAFGPHTIWLGRNHIWRYCSPRDGVWGAF